jgi:hypothetical protein
VILINVVIFLGTWLAVILINVVIFLGTWLAVILISVVIMVFVLAVLLGLGTKRQRVD